jgi:hypothetical protein
VRAGGSTSLDMAGESGHWQEVSDKPD